MQHDIIIRGGQIADGTGRAAYRGDVAIDGDRISAVGRVDGSARREIDAEGHTVSPGFIDLHTHLDAQVGWDPDCTPVSWHGVTTALMGNCGVTFAPCKPADRPLLAAMMETVEDIPREAILGGLPWDWEDYGGYLDSIERLRPGINLCGLVGHSALRFYVMGERAVEEQATPEERARMAQIAGAAVDRGAMGCSLNRFAAHKLPDGRAIPGTFAAVGECVDIAREMGQRGALMQAVGADFGLLRALADEGGSKVLFSYGVGPDGRLAPQRRSDLETLCQGRDITAVAQVRSSGFVFGLQSAMPIATRADTWRKLKRLNLAQRLAVLADPVQFQALVAEARRDGFPELLGAGIEKVYYMGDAATPDYAAGDERQLLAMASAAGEHWAQTFLRLALETGGRALFTLRMFNPDMAALAHLIGSANVLPGLGDAGAHVSQVMDAGWASFVLAHWVRAQGLYSLEEGVRRLTAAPAAVLGLRDRGVLAPGLRADVNVFDPARVGEQQPRMVHDFPGGAARYIQRATGYRATLVNGRVNLCDGELTGERAGQVLRHARAGAPQAGA
jgi:N-acyl-D-aspartate/D-glutamate deacylase